MHSKRSYVVVSSRDDHIRWLQSALSDMGDIVVSDTQALERVLQIIDVTGAQIVFVDVNREELSKQTSVIEGLLAVKPLISIVALSREPDSDLILSTMRAGASDLLVPGEDPAKVTSILHRLNERSPKIQQRDKSGNTVVLANARPDGDTIMLALHLALAAQEMSPDSRTLLLDLGVPQGDALLYLGINSSYTFIDAVHSLRRLDETLIESAFAAHSSGLRILDMPKDMRGMEDITSADIFVLLGTLKAYFKNIIINLGGVPESEFLYVLLSHSDKTLVVVEQSVPSVQQNMALIKRIGNQKLPLDNINLVVDRYYSKLVPNADVIAKGFGLELATTLPPCGLARLNVINSGMSMFETAPKEPYCQKTRKLAKELFEIETAQPKRQGSGILTGFNRIKRLLFSEA